MCGIAGFISSNKEYDSKSLVKSMLDKIRYRGPDQIGFKSYGDVTLGMVRLSIIDKNKHDLPYESDRSNFAIVYNGEIYNHLDYRDKLKEDYLFKTESDAETVLYNFIKNGTHSFNNYNGMYVFAIYDFNSHACFVVRDKTGEKPLYYTYGKDYFAFSSEMKSLLCLVEPQINNNAISYRAYEFTVGEETLFKGIYCLEPGEYLKIKDDGTFTKHEYWKIWDNLIEVEDNEKSVLNQLTELVEDSILLRTKNCVHKYGCFVSGGVDSSLIACISKPDYIYTVHYDYEDFDELEFAKSLARKIKKELIIIKPTKEDFMRTKDNIIYHLDSPCTWTSFSLWMLLERAKKDLKVVLSGEGADEIFSGYHRYHLLNHDEQIRDLAAMKQYSYLISQYYGSPVERYSRIVNRSENRFDEAINSYLSNTIGSFFSRIDNDIVHAMGLNDFYTTMQVLLQMSDRLSMAFSIENRSPYLDYRLIQFAFSVPSKYKIRNGITKWALKEIAKKFIPRKIVSRVDKRGFSAPVNRWFEWGQEGSYNRTAYKNMIFEDWKKAFGLNGAKNV